jgi:hypothetical protein
MFTHLKRDDKQSRRNASPPVAPRLAKR